MQPPGQPRRFNLVDTAILVMATALSFWVIRDSLAGLFKPPMVLEEGRWVKRWWDPVVLLNRVVTVEVVLLSWSLAWATLQLRHPRRPLRRLTRQPGFVASASSAFVALVCGPMTAAILASSHRSANIPDTGSCSKRGARWCRRKSAWRSRPVGRSWPLGGNAGAVRAGSTESAGSSGPYGWSWSP